MQCRYIRLPNESRINFNRLPECKRPLSSEAIRGGHQFGGDSGLEGRMAGLGHHPKIGLRPGPGQVVSGPHRADDIVAALDDHRWDVSNRTDVGDQLVVAIEKPAIDEVVTFDSGKGKENSALPN